MVDFCSVTSYFKIQCPRVGLEVTVGGIPVTQCTFSSLIDKSNGKVGLA